MPKDDSGRKARNVQGAVDKRVPPPFLARRGGRMAPVRWWRGLTLKGKLGLAASLLLAVALVIALSAGLTGGPARRAKPPEPKPVSLSSIPAGSARMEMAALAAGLAFTLREVSRTSLELREELDSTYGASSGASGGSPGGRRASFPPQCAAAGRLLASLEVIADGSDGAAPSTGDSPRSVAAARYLERYRRYAGRLASIRAALEEVPAATRPGRSARSALAGAADELLRDVSAVADGLERLGDDPGQDREIALGISAALGRLASSEARVLQLLEELGGGGPHD